MFKFIYILSLVLFVIACSDDGPIYIDELEIRQARSEKEFVKNPSLKTIPGCVIIGQLESKNNPEADSNDIQLNLANGIDAIPITFEIDGEFNFRIDETAEFTIKLINSQNTEIFKLSNSNKSVNLNILKGDYKYIIENISTSDTSSKRRIPYFIIPDYETLTLSGEINKPQTSVYKSIDKATFFTSKLCKGCNLKNVDLSFMILTDVDFSNSISKSTNFTSSNLSRSKFNHSNLNHALFKKAILIDTQMDSIYDFSHATFERATIKNVSFIDSYSRIATFISSNIENSNFKGTTLSKCKMSGAIIKNTIIENVDLSESDISYTTFTDARALGANFCNTNRSNWFATNLSVDSTTICIPADTTKK